jgi:hypothetical protein
VKVTTTGDQQLVLAHISYYLDMVVHVFADGTVSFEREHVVYRFGNQNDEVDEQARRDIRTAVDSMLLDLVEFAPREVGVYAQNDDDAADREMLARAQHSLANVRTWKPRLERKRNSAIRDVEENEARERELTRDVAELTARIAERMTT